MQRGIKEEAKRLYLLGFGVHWIKENSKAPVEQGWASGKRQTFEELKATWKPTYGIGVRLGDASQLKDGAGYLANIDLDVKSGQRRHTKEAIRELKKLIPGAVKAPVIRTGNGLRFLVRTSQSAGSVRLARSKELTKVRLNEKTIPISQKAYIAKDVITLEELENGWRVRPAWEIDLLGNGKQGVFPPSRHPETGKFYTWHKDFETLGEIPLIQLPDLSSIDEEKSDPAPAKALKKRGREFVKAWQPEDIDVDQLPIPEKWKNVIKTQDGVEDASAAAHAVAMVMLSHDMTEDEILSVLTDPENALGDIGYRHRQTRNRKKAAAWVYDYCLRKAKGSVAPEFVFDSPIEEKKLTKKEAKEQEKEIFDEMSWLDNLDRTKEGKPRTTLKNTILALSSLFGRQAFVHDEFANRNFFGRQVPWAVSNQTVEEIHLINIKTFLSQHYEFEPTKATVDEALQQLCHGNRINPAKDFIMGLEPWDGVERIDGWLQRHFSAHGPNDYINSVFRKWLVAAVARIFEPGLKFDWIPILEGAQGRGKSLFGRILFGDIFFTDQQLPSLDHAMPSAVMQIQGKMCVELGELTAFNKSTLESIKAFITRQVDHVRMPYEKLSRDFPRRCVFYGTTNNSAYLRDETGNRRFNPIPVGQLDIKALQRDRLKLWSEAVFIYQNGLEPHFYLEGEIQEAAEQMQKDKKEFSENDHVEELLVHFIVEGHEFPWVRFKTEDLFRMNCPLENLKYDARNGRTVVNVLRKMGGIEKRTKAIRYWSLDANRFGKLPSTQGAPAGTMLN